MPHVVRTVLQRWRELSGMRMSLRSWAIRGSILSGVAAIVALVWVANSWVSPERVRAQVLEHLTTQFEGDKVDVQIGAARMRILGGIAVSDLRLTRRGEKAPFLIVPTVVLYHDKEILNRGQLVIKRIVLESPELILERSEAGNWNVSDLFEKKGLADKPVPAFVVNDGVVRIVDRGPEPLPELSLNSLQLTLTNDPIPILAIKAQANAVLAGCPKPLGPSIARARLNRITGVFEIGLELSDVPLGEVVKGNVDRFVPGLSQQLSGLKAKATVVAKLTHSPDVPKKWGHDISVELKDARFSHPNLPWPVENIAATLHVTDGRMSVQEARAKLAGATISLSFESRANAATIDCSQTPADDFLTLLEDRLSKLELSIGGLSLDDVLFGALPPRAQRARRQFSPIGQIDVAYKFTRETGGWRRELELRPKQIAMSYEKFKYPVTEVGGTVKRTATHAGEISTAVDLLGTAAGQKITIKGLISGEGEDPGINLRVVGANIPIDDSIFAALPPKYAEMIRRFRATGRGDFVAEIIQAPGVNLCENEFRIDVRDASLRHVDFPYPLDKVKGQLIVKVAASDPSHPIRPGEPIAALPDREEIILHGFTATHAGATVVLSGSKRAIPKTNDKKLQLHVEANNCPVDDDLKATGAAFKIDSVWTTFRPRNKLSFKADLELIDRSAHPNRGDLELAIDPAADLKLTFSFLGATVVPTFFPYEMNDFSGWLEYKEGRVVLKNFTALHGDSRMKLERGEALFYPDGRAYADLRELEIKPLVANEDFIRALPAKLGSGVEALKLKGRSELAVERLVVLTPPDSPGGVQKSNADYLQQSPSAKANEDERLHASTPTVVRGQLPSTSPQSSSPDPIVFWDLKLKLIGASLDLGVAWDRAFGAVSCRGRYESTHTGMVLGALWIDSTAIAGQPVSRISGNFAVKEQTPDPSRPGEYYPSVVEFPNLSGELFHGMVGGQARVVLSAPVRFDLWLKAADVQLEEVAKHYIKQNNLGSDADLKGIAQAQLFLHNGVDSAVGQTVVEGWGKIDVPTGRMYNLPILLDLVKIFKFNAPDKTAFEEAHAIFRIQGDRVKVEQIDLIGRSVCLGGSGEFDTSGNYVKFDFYTIISQVLARLINTPVGDLTKFLSQNLLVIRLTRENGELKYKQEAVPMITETARLAADRLRVRVAKLFEGK